MQHITPKDQQSHLVIVDTSTSNIEEGKIACRGRPKKLGKPKISQAIVATGKGRGRPKKPANSADEIGNDELAKRDTVERPSLPLRQSKSGTSVEGRGRPRKPRVCSDSENSSYDEKPDYEERRPVGRPSTGAVNLNIVRTGRGQGRPRKSIQSNRPNAVPPNAIDSQPARKRGRPYKGGVPYEHTGKPRGRPKANKHNSCEKVQGESHQSDVEVEMETKDQDNKTLLQNEAGS
ncbi:PREDICTED: chromosomal protein D1-like [Rhagoletis zephyria]|uniref:chromosomal protein D1-like n=1 Tax=Rhagoletis zephyria TaxID=28612 RepID=UPI00081172CD|nr:PREDICTED: chromosomal protein D1-like [Rhagoletis zephyria]XP_017461096.1 PREDICTED: chromosomal protein D1-like [Rhagoletis zephyria]